jgi:hypothetical protein
MKFKENLYSIVTFNILEYTRYIFSCWSFYILVTDIDFFLKVTYDKSISYANMFTCLLRMHTTDYMLTYSNKVYMTIAERREAKKIGRGV